MKSVIRLSLLLALVALVALVPGLKATHAQDMACLPSLSASDCALFQAATTNQTSIKTFVVDYDVALHVTGTPQDIAFTAKGNGPIDISNVTGTDQMAAIEKIVLQNAIEASVTQGGSTMSDKIEVRIVDGVLYFMDEMSTQGKWMKTSLSSMTSGMTSMMPSSDMTSMASPELIKAFQDFASVPNLITSESGAGDTIDGVATTKITVNINLSVLFKTLLGEQGRPIIKAIMEAQGQKMTDEELTQQLAQAQQAAAMLEPTLQNTKLSVAWLIDPEAKQFRGFSMNFSTKVDPTLASMFSGGSSQTPIDADFSLNVKLSKVGEAVTVEPVADAVDASEMGGATATAQP